MLDISGQDIADIEALTGERKMPEVEMSAKAVTARLKLISQLRRLALSLGRAKLKDARGDSRQLPAQGPILKEKPKSE